ncbi:glycosyltransferase family 2 protein [Dyadobacter aurulentus]|uniref:glycosyltransferase family 2 protein n=1 Tax=Dyadobacter sp. UC 10 TaxID=2605428 RepID=UPI0011F365E9|nr:glycosyltransferase [Dyadobacter sp. UC 10]KAA0988754.1 glycosyltransferase [Dyadobacter sp. UC 10]
MENKADVTVILTVWKRNHLKEQIEALLAQTSPPAHIWVIQCMQHVSIKEVLREYPQVKFFQSDEDLKYFSRFSIGIHVRSEFTWVLDDDIIPASGWIDKCISTCRRYNAIVSSNGRIIPRDDFHPEKVKGADYTQRYFIGDSTSRDSVNLCDRDSRIDFPCSSYFFKTEWLKYFWGIWPLTLETAEDIHFAATCQILGGISVMVPRQLSESDSGNVKPAYSLDEHASWKRWGFSETRAEVIRCFITEKGWKPLLW